MARLSHNAKAWPLLNYRVSHSVTLAADANRPPPGARFALGCASRSRRACRRVAPADRDRPIGRRRPDEPAALQPFGVERHADPVMPENFDQVTALAAEHIEIAGVRGNASPPALGSPGCSCRAACRCARPPAIPERRTGPGSSPRQCLDHRRRQIRWDRPRYPHPHLTGELDLDRRLGDRGAICGLRRRLGRRDQHLRKTVRDGAQFLPPTIDLPSADIGAAGDLADRRSWRQALRDDRPFLFLDQRRRRSGPVITSIRAIGTVSCTGASTVICTHASNSAEPALNARRPSPEGYV